MTAGTLGSRLRGRRLELELTIAQVADRAGLSMQYVANLERNRGNPTLDALTKIAAALGVSVGTLVGDDDDDADVTDDGAVEALALGSMPRSLVGFSRTERFKAKLERLAHDADVPIDEMRRRVLVGMASAPRRSKGEPTNEDWMRLLDTYELIIRG